MRRTILIMLFVSSFLGLSIISWAHEKQEDAVLQKIGFDQKLNQKIPLDAVFTDESGHSIKLGDYFGKKPVVLTLVYYECPMLCTVSLNGLVRALRAMPFTAGKEFEILTVSFDPKEKPFLAVAKKKTYLTEYGRPSGEQGWHFLVGDKPNIDALTQSVGFRYTYDEHSKQFAHPVGLVILTPQGKISKYFYDVEYSPRDMRMALVEASEGKIGNPIDKILLYCYHYDPVTGKYGLLIMRILRAAGVLTFLILAAFVLVMLRLEKRRGHV